MGYRPNVDGAGMALSGDRTTTGARLISSIPLSQVSIHGHGVIRIGDKTTPCPVCGKPGTVVQGAAEYARRFMGIQVAVDKCLVSCDCPTGSNRIRAPLGAWVGSGPSPGQLAAEKQAAAAAVLAVERAAAQKRREEERERNRVFAKSCLRGDGCNDAGEAPEPHTHFARMAFYRASPPADPYTDSDATQHAQTAKRKQSIAPEDIPKPKQRSALWKWFNGDHEEYAYQVAVASAAAATRAETLAGSASVLELLGGSSLTAGTWAVRAGGVATGGIGAPVAGLLIGMMPGRLNDGEQDFIDRMRAEQMREAPTRVRYTWETDSNGHPTPRGWHTPPGKDRVRVRRMAWDSSLHAYAFTTEDDPRITIIWTPDRSEHHRPWDTGNQTRPVLPNPVMVNPLPDNTRITTTSSPAADEKSFADYILILPLANIPPIYIYLSKPPVAFLDVALYSDFKRRSRQGKYEVDHMPSAAAARAALLRDNPRLRKHQLDAMVEDVAAIVIPKEVHLRISETYGGRNSPAQIELDSRNLRAAVDRNLGAITSALKEHGATESQIEAARVKMHKLNSEMGLYK
jgi:pyocin large subunit-like protein/uncharacterized Zn-binding protein involved in type VI secretion